jgi:hypothetical protein
VKFRFGSQKPVRYSKFVAFLAFVILANDCATFMRPLSACYWSRPHVLTVLIYFDFQIINKGPRIYPTYWVLWTKETKEPFLSLPPSSRLYLDTRSKHAPPSMAVAIPRFREAAPREHHLHPSWLLVCL